MLTKIWQFIKRDPLRRGVALAFALFLYMHLNFQLTSDRHLTRVRVAVTLALSPELQEQTGKPPEIALTLKGKPGAEFVQSKVQVSVKVSSQNRQPDGSFLVKVTPKNIRITDRKFSLYSIDFPEDGNLRLTLLSRRERHVPVKVSFDKAVPLGKKLNCETIPEKILVTGPENILSELSEVHTRPVPLGGAQDFFEFNAPVTLPNGVIASPATVLVRVTLDSLYSKRSMRLPVTLLSSPESTLTASLLSPLPGGVTVVLRGPVEKIASLTEDQVRVFADTVRSATPGRRQIPLRCAVTAPQIEVVSIEPNEIEIQLTTKTSK